MDFSTDDILDSIIFLHNNKKELITELKEDFHQHFLDRKDFPTGFYLQSFDHKLGQKMKEHLAARIADSLGFDAEKKLLLQEEEFIQAQILEIIKESYE